MRVTRKPSSGKRQTTLDDDDTIPLEYRSIVTEKMLSYPLPYTVQYVGYHPKQVALSFDDGPDPDWTPKILDILKKYKVVGTFFLIGEEARGERRRDAAHLPRRTRDRKPHLYASRYLQHLQQAARTGDGIDRAPLRLEARR